MARLYPRFSSISSLYIPGVEVAASEGLLEEQDAPMACQERQVHSLEPLLLREPASMPTHQHSEEECQSLSAGVGSEFSLSLLHSY